MHALLVAFFMQGGVAAMNSPPDADDYGYTYWLYDENEVRNPYGIVELGFEHNYGRWNVSLAGRHISSLTTAKDHGTNTIEFNVRVHPFQ